MIYLLHFNRRYKHAKHYLGYAASVARRNREHKAGKGAKLTRVVKAAGIGWRIARIWRGPRADRTKERALKNNYYAKDLCPCCSGPSALNRGKL